MASELSSSGVRHEYESVVIPYVKRPATYRPDFLLLDNGILIETKGRFLAADRTKHLLVKQQHPGLDIRFVFERSKSRLSPGSRSTYASWCQKQGFLYADVSIPQEWIEEAPCPVRIAAVMALRKGPAK